MRARRRRLLGGQKSLEEEPVGRQRAHHQRRKHGGRAGQGRHARALLACRAHELVAGVGDQRGAGIGDERDGGALGEPCQQLGPGLGGVVVVIGRERGGDGVMVESLRVTRVSSQAIRSAAARTSSARTVMSRRFPIGVATRCRPGASGGAVTGWPWRT